MMHAPMTARLRSYLLARARAGALLLKNEAIAADVGCDESTVRRVMGAMLDAGEVEILPAGRRRRVIFPARENV